MRMIAAIAGVMLAVMFAASSASADKRVALIIGNATYQSQPILFNPKNDAEVVSKALIDLGFKVTLGLDLTRAGMNEKLDQFSRDADGADIAIVYYSGHGMQFAGTNYLLPIDATLDNAADVNPFRLVRIDSVMETLSMVRGAKIVVLDACRDNPVEGELKRKLAAIRGTRGGEVTRGLGAISADGLLIAYATQPNKTALDGKGRNSPFTAAFVNNVSSPDIDIRAMFFRVQDEVDRETDHKQRPELSISLVGEYKLKITITPIAPGTSVPPVVQVPSADPNAVTRRDYEFAEKLGTKEAWEAFLASHPDGYYASLARGQIAKLAVIKPQVEIPVAPRPLPPSTLLGTMGSSSRWAVGGSKNCNVASKAYTLQVNSREVVWTDGTGNVYIETIVASTESEFRTETRRSPNQAVGTGWLYARPTRKGDIVESLWVTQAGKSSFFLERCP